MLPIDPDDGDSTVTIFLPAVEDEAAQAQWVCAEFSRIRYNSKNNAKNAEKLKANIPQISESHMQLWPGVAVPQITARPRAQKCSSSGDGLRVNTMSTSLVIATLVWAFTHPNKQCKDRAHAGKMLRILINFVCEAGVRADILRFQPDGRHHWFSQEVDESGVCECFTEAYSEHVGMLWDEQLASAQVPWVSSPRGRMLLADFICFALSPLPVRSRQDTLRAVKRQLIPSALSVITQIALRLETAVIPDYELQSMLPKNLASFIRGGTKRRRISPELMNGYAARALDLLITGQDGP